MQNIFVSLGLRSQESSYFVGLLVPFDSNPYGVNNPNGLISIPFLKSLCQSPFLLSLRNDINIELNVDDENHMYKQAPVTRTFIFFNS